MFKRSSTQFIALQGAASPEAVALCAAVALPSAAGADAPEWIHLLPAGEIRTADGRGPYRVKDAADLIKVSLQAANGPLVLDENHATDLAGPKGEPAPARGWITDLQARQDGIWGKVDWTKSGTALMADKAYRHISPVITHLEDGQVTGILRASLINKPNLKGLVALQQEQTHMDFMKKIAAALGLGEDATPEAILAAIAKMNEKTNAEPALQAALDPIAKIAGVATGSNAAAVLAGVEKLAGASGDGKSILALQSELTELGTKFVALQTSTATEKATAFVDGEIRKGRVGVKPLRDHYIAMHAQDATRVEKEIGALPILGASGASIVPLTPDKDGNVTLDDNQKQIAQLMGIDPAAYAKTLKEEREAAL